MIRYEVTLNIEKDIEKPFKEWLENHVKQMLLFKGFTNATIHEENLDNNIITVIIVNYIIDCKDNLKYYFKVYSNKMREDGLKKFPNQFTASRRVFDNEIEINL
tara:strand:+ start:469 stop:780 length:312 start_codon:yes stop_codon:yes gene_type:complete